MSQDIRIEQQSPVHALEISRDVSMWRLPKVLGDDFPLIEKHIAAKGGTRVGAPYVRYLNIDWEQMRNSGPLMQIWLMLTTKQPIRIGMAVEAPLVGDGEIEAVVIKAQPCVRAIHRGPYQKVGRCYNEIVDWARARDVELADQTMENYMNDPTTVAKEEIETLILVPVAGRAER